MTADVKGNKDRLLMGMLLALLAFFLYWPALHNFFTWDDFLWLYRAKTLTTNPLQIFGIDAVYFDPLVYLWFWLDFQLHGLNFFWYHAADIALHAVNALLVYCLVAAVAKDRLAAVCSAVLFVGSFATVDAVAWSSSRVDLLAVFFSLLTLIFFQRYLSGSKGSLCLSLVAFILALGSKGTPLLLPGVLAVMLLKAGRREQFFRLLGPYLGIVFIYLILLFWRLAVIERSFVAGEGARLNVHNLALAAGELFLPESRLVNLNAGLVAVILLLVIAGLSRVRLAENFAGLRLVGLSLMVVGLLPVLILKDFKLTTSLQDAGYLLSSPSHRIYMATLGASCFAGSILAFLFAHFNRKSLCYLLLALLTCYSFYEIRLRQELWKGSAVNIRKAVEGLAVYRPIMMNDSTVVLVNFPMSRGFMRPVLSLYCGVDNALLLPMSSVPPDIPDSPEILSSRNRCFMFVYNNEIVSNLSTPFAKLLDIAFYYQLSGDNQQREKLLVDYRRMADELNVDIASARN